MGCSLLPSMLSHYWLTGRTDLTCRVEQCQDYSRSSAEVPFNVDQIHSNISGTEKSIWEMLHCTCLNHHSSSSFLACNSRLRSAIRRHHPPQRAILSQICCFGERKMVMFQILLDGAEPCDAGTTQLSSPVCQRGGQQDPLGICIVVHAHNVPQ